MEVQICCTYSIELISINLRWIFVGFNLASQYRLSSSAVSCCLSSFSRKNFFLPARRNISSTSVLQGYVVQTVNSAAAPDSEFPTSRSTLNDLNINMYESSVMKICYQTATVTAAIIIHFDPDTCFYYKNVNEHQQPWPHNYNSSQEYGKTAN